MHVLLRWRVPLTTHDCPAGRLWERECNASKLRVNIEGNLVVEEPYYFTNDTEKLFTIPFDWVEEISYSV